MAAAPFHKPAISVATRCCGSLAPGLEPTVGCGAGSSTGLCLSIMGCDRHIHRELRVWTRSGKPSLSLGPLVWRRKKAEG